MTESKAPLAQAIEIVSNLGLARYKISSIWRDIFNDYRMLWPIATFTERLKLLGFAPISIVAAIWWTFRGGCWLLVGSLALKGMIRLAKSNPAGDAYGVDLAQAVANKLVEDNRAMTENYGAGVTFSHRDYCGQGLFYGWPTLDGFRLCHSEDGYPSTTVLQFDTSPAFVDWLAAQSDLSMSGVVGPLKDSHRVGNQRLTKDRLTDYVAGVT